MTELPITAVGETASGGCACCSTSGTENSVTENSENSDTAKDTAMSTDLIATDYTVSGMTCGHCVASVTEEVGAIEGVSSVEVDLPTGRVTVTSSAPLDPAAVKAAVAEAGYELVA